MQIPHCHDQRVMQPYAPKASHQGLGSIRGARLIFPFELQQLSVHRA